jgi:hypothetical protein
MARRLDAAIQVTRQAVDELGHAGRTQVRSFRHRHSCGALLERGAKGDLTAAQRAIDRLAKLPDDDYARSHCWGRAPCWPRACADDGAYRDLVTRYRAMAESLRFERHIAWAEAMT